MKVILVISKTHLKLECNWTLNDDVTVFTTDHNESELCCNWKLIYILDHFVTFSKYSKKAKNSNVPVTWHP